MPKQHKVKVRVYADGSAVGRCDSCTFTVEGGHDSVQSNSQFHEDHAR
jgi:hypothetical protein